MSGSMSGMRIMEGSIEVQEVSKLGCKLEMRTCRLGFQIPTILGTPLGIAVMISWL
jgi:hypothetical protein